jgi:hypothetical protein
VFGAINYLAVSEFIDLIFVIMIEQDSVVARVVLAGPGHLCAEKMTANPALPDMHAYRMNLAKRAQ